MEGGAGAEEVKPFIDHAPQLNAAAVAFKRFGLQTKSCVVTGGTKGIGAAIVHELASLKAKVGTYAAIGLAFERVGNLQRSAYQQL